MCRLCACRPIYKGLINQSIERIPCHYEKGRAELRTRVYRNKITFSVVGRHTCGCTALNHQHAMIQDVGPGFMKYRVEMLS